MFGEQFPCAGQPGVPRPDLISGEPCTHRGDWHPIRVEIIDQQPDGQSEGLRREPPEPPPAGGFPVRVTGDRHAVQTRQQHGPAGPAAEPRPARDTGVRGTAAGRGDDGLAE